MSVDHSAVVFVGRRVKDISLEGVFTPEQAAFLRANHDLPWELWEKGKRYSELLLKRHSCYIRDSELFIGYDAVVTKRYGFEELSFPALVAPIQERMGWFKEVFGEDSDPQVYVITYQH